MKKIFVLLLGCLTATVVSILAFANNVVVVVRWWDMFLEAGGDTALMGQEVTGIIPWLDWAAVDYSAVTTFIPMLGLIFMTRALFTMMRKKRVASEDFPFFPGSDQLYVALGLFGTLWGIIVIGYFKLETVAMADLMQCLHTALFSTLMAVVWVFLIDRPLVRPYFKRLLIQNELAETEDGDIDETIKKFIVRLGKAADAFETRQTAFEKRFTERQNACEKSFREQQAIFEKVFRDRQSGFEKRAQEQSAAFAKAFMAQQAAFEEAAKAREAAFQEGLNKCFASVAEALSKQIEVISTASESRQKSSDEAFANRIASMNDQIAKSDEIIANRQKASDEAFANTLASLNAQVAKSDEIIANRQKASDEIIANRQKASDEAIANRQKASDEAIANALANMNEQIAKSDAATAQRVATYEQEFEARQKEYVEVFRRRIDELQASTNEAKSRAEASDARLDAITKALRA